MHFEIECCAQDTRNYDSKFIYNHNPTIARIFPHILYLIFHCHHRRQIIVTVDVIIIVIIVFVNLIITHQVIVRTTDGVVTILTVVVDMV